MKIEPCGMEKYPDIYFEPAYARLYESEDSKAEEFRFECEYGLITNLFLKRSIPVSLGNGARYYDLITPYGYGGPVIHWSSDQEKLIKAYMAEFQAYTERENIVDEFVRFHPILGNGKVFQEAYGSLFDRKTVGTNLTYDDVIGIEFSKHKRKDIRKILSNSAISYEVCEHPETLDDFMEVYYATMDRDNASDYYYFSQEYFRNILSSFPKNVITGKVFLGGKLIAMGLYFRYGKYLHAHLSGTLSEYLDLSPAYILKYALALWGHENGYQVIHYGGGSSRSPENGLYKFKKDFGRTTEFDFYITKKIWNKEQYLQINKVMGANMETEFFPAYREGR